MLRDIHLESPRLFIRPVVQKDYHEFVEGYRNCLPPLNRFDEVYDDTNFMTPLWFEELIQRRDREAERDYSYKLDIFRKEDHKIIGFCNVFPHYREDFQYAHIGYAIHNPFWGQGYGTETVCSLIQIGFQQLNLHRLEAHVNLDNPASKKVLLKSGFEFECVRKGFIYEEGVWTDNEIYYINNGNYQFTKNENGGNPEK